MATWAEFERQAGDLAERGAARFREAGLAVVGTLRRDGRPRISPVEPLIAHGELWLGMIWQSRKALDLLRDPRCVVHSAVSDSSGGAGDFKLYGSARDVTDPARRDAYGEALEQAIGWQPRGDFHLFTVDIDEVAWVRLGSGPRELLHWRPGAAVEAGEAPAPPS